MKKILCSLFIAFIALTLIMGSGSIAIGSGVRPKVLPIALGGNTPDSAYLTKPAGCAELKSFTIYSPSAGTHMFSDGFNVTISHKANNTIAFSSNWPVSHVWVQGGQIAGLVGGPSGGNLYRYYQGLTEDSGLYALNNHFINHITFYYCQTSSLRGSLNVTKNVRLGDAIGSITVPTFTIGIKGPSYPDWNNKDFSAGNYNQTWSNLLPGTYEVREVNPGSTWAVAYSSLFVQVNSGVTSTVAVTNTYTVNPPQYSTQTAWAYGGDKAIPLSTLVNSNNWGWTNGAYGSGTHTMDLYAAESNNSSKGIKVGRVLISHIAGRVNVTYETFAGFTLKEVQLYVGSEPLPQVLNGKKLEYTLSQFPYRRASLADGTTTTSFGPINVSGSVYVAANAVVHGVFEGNTVPLPSQLVSLPGAGRPAGYDLTGYKNFGQMISEFARNNPRGASSIAPGQLKKN